VIHAWRHGDIFNGEFNFPPPRGGPATWPLGCEIGQAVETNLDSGFAMASRRIGGANTVADITELVTRLSESSGPEILGLLDRYESDYEWWNDYDFIVRYLVGSFVDEFDDLSADSLKSILDFVGVGPVDDQVIEQVVQQYSQDGTHHFTHVEQMALVEDWFTCKLQFTEITGQLNAFEQLEEIAR